MTFKTQQEQFWAGEFGDAYVEETIWEMFLELN